MARRVYLHIGAPKTGTTYLQTLLDRNRGVLEEVGVRYADGLHRNDRVWATEVLREMPMRNRPSHAAGAWDRILEQVGAWPDTAVFSHEFLGACSREQAQRVFRDLAPAEVHVVFTARDYVKQTAAVWQERLKYGFDVPFSSFTLDNDTPAWSWRTQDIPAILDRWCPDMDPARVHLIVVPAGTSEPEQLWQKFASVVGAESATVEGVTTANTSLGLVEAELLRRVDQRVRERGLLRRPPERTQLLRDVLANSILSQGSRERFTVPPESWHELRLRAEAAVESITRSGYHVVGSLDDLLPQPPTDGGRVPEQATDAELVDASLDAITALLTRQQRAGTVRRAEPAERSGADGAARDAVAPLRSRIRAGGRFLRRGGR